MLPFSICSTSSALTSSSCSQGLASLLQPEQSALLAIATEASTHSSGLLSVYYQPYLYAGGGLGNVDECPLLTCLATSSNLLLAGLCVPLECTAADVASDDFVATVQRHDGRGADYVTLMDQVHHVTKFLQPTTWTCGDYQVSWNWGTNGIYMLLLLFSILATMVGTLRHANKTSTPNSTTNSTTNGTTTPTPTTTTTKCEDWTVHWNITTNIQKLWHRRTACCLDGLRVLSILWIMLGHCMAIQSTGYSNPADFLPPKGISTTFMGQLFFASRFAVDTFFVMSGYLVVGGILSHCSPTPQANHQQHHTQTFLWRYLTTFPKLLLGRLLRILPTYLMILGAWIYVAPHISSGPLWYVWQSLLQPCFDYGWTNILFINNLYPPNAPNTSTCFYHSWYLAVDVQLFIVAALLVHLYQDYPRIGKLSIVLLMLLSMATTLYLTFTRHWSIHSFDGAAVARFDEEGYAKPYIRAQAYLAGMLVALHGTPRLLRKCNYHLLLTMAFSVMSIITFCTMTGAYARRPCSNEEWPNVVECGSIWSDSATMLYTGTSRALWSMSIAVIMMVCLEHETCWVNQLLALQMWTPLSHLTFSAYLVHPMVIFTWQLSSRQKQAFGVFDFLMKYVAVATVSFGLAVMFCMICEFPLANMMKQYYTRRAQQPPPDVEMEPILMKYGSMNGLDRNGTLL